MCGIIGFAGHVNEGQWGQTYRMLHEMYVRSEVRGTHATGFAAMTQPFKDRQRQQVIMGKGAVRASSFLRHDDSWRALRHRRCAAFVGHVRMATHGHPRHHENNHPFISECGQQYLVHNGILRNHDDVAMRLRLRVNTECDSEVILRLVEHYGDAALGLDRAMRIFDGSMAVAMLDVEQDCVWLATNGHRPLWLLRLVNDRRLFFASTRMILVNSVASVIGRQSAKRFDLLMPLGRDSVHVIDFHGTITALE